MMTGALVCGVAAVDVPAGRVIGLLEFQTAVEEIFDVQLLPGVRFPEVVGFQKDDIRNTFVIPPAAGARYTQAPSHSHAEAPE